MRLFYDTEQDHLITEAQLQEVFDALKSEDPETYNYSFNEYVRECCSKNGVLVLISY